MQLKAIFSGLFIFLLGNYAIAQTKVPPSNEPAIIVGQPLEETPTPEPIAPEGFEKTHLVDVSQNDALKAVILAQLDAFRNQDYSKAYYAYTSSDFQNTVPLETFKIFVRKSPALYKNHSFVLQSVSFAGVVATVKGTLKGNNDQDAQAEYQLIQENGNWKIRKMELFGAPMSQEKK